MLGSSEACVLFDAHWHSCLNRRASKQKFSLVQQRGDRALSC
jgi:hypothetical protein